MSCCRNGFFAGIFAGRRNMTVILTFDPQFTERTVQITHIVFPRRSHYGSTTLQANKKRNHSSDEGFSSLNTKLEPAVNFDCKKCLKLLRFLEKDHCTVSRTIARICQTKSFRFPSPLPMTTRAPQSILVSNLLTPPQNT